MSDSIPFPNNQVLLIRRTKLKRKTLFRNIAALGFAEADAPENATFYFSIFRGQC